MPDELSGAEHQEPTELQAVAIEFRTLFLGLFCTSSGRILCREPSTVSCTTTSETVTSQPPSMLHSMLSGSPRRTRELPWITPAPLIWAPPP